MRYRHSIIKGQPEVDPLHSCNHVLVFPLLRKKKTKRQNKNLKYASMSISLNGEIKVLFAGGKGAMSEIQLKWESMR